MILIVSLPESLFMLNRKHINLINEKINSVQPLNLIETPPNVSVQAGAVDTSVERTTGPGRD